MSATQVFASKAPKYMKKLMEDFSFQVLDAAAIMGNCGYESNGTTTLQEIKPVVPGSRGGFGWFQWTGPRRVAFESYCKRNNLNPKDDDANYRFLFTELVGPEKKAVARTKAATGLEGKVRAFEESYERAGVKNYAARNQWARRALAAWEAQGFEVVTPPEEKPVVDKGEAAGAGTAGAGAAVAAAAAGWDWGLILFVGVAIAIVTFVVMKMLRD